jgi:hypothetical protein
MLAFGAPPKRGDVVQGIEATAHIPGKAVPRRLTAPHEITKRAARSVLRHSHRTPSGFLPEEACP